MNEAIDERFRRLEPLIDRALELSGEKRERFLALCEGIYPDLIFDLRTALSEDEALMPRLGGLAEELTREQPTNRHGLRAGSWRLLEKIGRGGMGAVYLAERADGAFEKRVAIKLLRGNDPRFRDSLERERHLLAKLDHPGIARLIDGGVTGDGQPWLAMELAEGENLDVWLKHVNPSLHERLGVFVEICEAVAYAHDMHLVHRDLKPSNIRVADNGSVKLLDFGIAKWLLPEAESGVTRQLALTPEFAAPEQLCRDPITMRTDVYSLGALLVFLLTGRGPHPPFDGNLPAYIGRIVDEDAPAPSALAADAAQVGVAISAEMLQGDLDAICTRALQRDPAQRHASVDALAQEVQRFLSNTAEAMHPSSWRNRVGHWVRRQR